MPRTKLEPDEAIHGAAEGASIWTEGDQHYTDRMADGPRYKALGNAWAVACVRPVARRVMVLSPSEGRAA